MIKQNIFTVKYSGIDRCFVATSSRFKNLSAFGSSMEEAYKEALIAYKGMLEVEKEDIIKGENNA